MTELSAICTRARASLRDNLFRSEERRLLKVMPMTTLQELLEQQAALNRQNSAARSAEQSRAISEIRALMAEHSLTAADTAAASAAAHKGATKKSGKKVAAKYRDPATGATWTDRGLNPKWLAQAVADGKTLSDFAI